VRSSSLDACAAGGATDEVQTVSKGGAALRCRCPETLRGDRSGCHTKETATPRATISLDCGKSVTLLTDADVAPTAGVQLCDFVR